jgi:hypothetical protein
VHHDDAMRNRVRQADSRQNLAQISRDAVGEDIEAEVGNAEQAFGGAHQVGGGDLACWRPGPESGGVIQPWTGGTQMIGDSRILGGERKNLTPLLP